MDEPSPSLGSRPIDWADGYPEEPVLGYNGTAGYDSTSDTSRDAAYDDLVSGVTAKAQRLTLILAAQQAAHGITIAELREVKGSLHHGKMSSALTNLHKGGRLARLAERRGRCHVYVLPEYIGERETQAYRPNRPGIDRTELVNLLRDHASTGGWRCQCGVYTRDPAGHRAHLADAIFAEFGR